jgi:hypothetical protein
VCFFGLACAGSKVAAPGAAGPVCSANLESAACRAVEVRAADYAFRTLGRTYVYAVRETGGEAPKESLKRFVVTAAGPGQIALVAENRLMAASRPSAIYFSAKGIEVDDQPAWPRYTIFPAATSSLSLAIANVETVVRAGKFTDTVALAYQRDERPEGANRLRISDKMVLAKGVGIVRRVVGSIRHGVEKTTEWALVAIEEPKKEEER